MAFVAINEVVNLMHECDLFLALGHNFVDDVHFLPVVDISVWGDSVNDRKSCIHDCTIKQIVFLLVLFSQTRKGVKAAFTGVAADLRRKNGGFRPLSAGEKLVVYVLRFVRLFVQVVAMRKLAHHVFKTTLGVVKLVGHCPQQLANGHRIVAVQLRHFEPRL